MTTPDELERLVRRGRYDEVRGALAALDEPARKALVPVVKALARREVRDGLPGDAQVALVTAQAGTVSGAAAVSDALRSRAWTWRGHTAVVTGALVDRHPAWLPLVVERLAERVDVNRFDAPPFQAVEALRLAAALPRPTAEGYLRGLAFVLSNPQETADLPALLRRDEEIVALVPRLLATDDVGPLLQLRDTRWTTDERGRLVERVDAAEEQTWPGALARAAADGLLDRAELLDTVLGQLLRGGKREHVASMLAVHDALAITPADVAQHRRTYARLLADGPSTVARSALGLLRAATVAEQLEPDGVLEAADAAVRRREKGLATTGLTWCRQLAGAGTVPVDDVALVIAAGLEHERRDVQERALSVLAPVVPQLRPDTVDSLRSGALAALPAVLRPEAESVLGPMEPGGGVAAALAADAPVAAAGPAPVPLRSAEPLVLTPADLTAAVAAHLEDGDPRAAERVLDGVSRFAAGDPEGFGAAMRPFAHRLTPSEDERRRAGGDVVLGSWGSAATRLLRAVLAPPAKGWFGRPARSKELQQWAVPHGVAGCLDVRAREVAERVLAGRSGPLLATPTTATGAVDPETLLDRLRTWQERGVEPGVHDLEQAWLRLPRTVPDPTWLARLRAVGSRAATWLAGAATHGPPDPTFRYAPVPPTVVRWGRSTPVLHAGITVVDVLPPPGDASSLVVRALTPAEPLPLLATREWWEEPAGTVPVLAVLLATPHHREVVAAHLVPVLLGTSRQCPPGAAEVLALLPEAGGATGPATVLAIGWAATGNDLQARTAAADAVRGFAATGALDGPPAGPVLGSLLLQPTVSIGRVTGTLADAARGDRRTQRLVWELFAGALPSVLGSGRRGVPDLLGLAAELAAEVGARGVVDGLDAVAGPGSTRLASEARRLQQVLGHGS